MAGSAAEERIRAVAEAALRQYFPDARIIHELMLQQWGRRIDLAAVTPQRLIVVEIKSERDVLTRLADQVKQAKLVADAVIVCVAAKHLEKARDIGGWLETCAEDKICVEIERHHMRKAMEATCNAPARLQMLWAEELRVVAGTGPRATREFSIRHASDNLTGAEVRRRVCAALRARTFPRADAPTPMPTWGML